jgi:hypothetical protein
MVVAISAPPELSSQADMDTAIALASVRVMLGYPDGINGVASVATLRIVPNFPYAPELRGLPMSASSRLEYVLMSVRLLITIDWFVVGSAMDTYCL